MAWALHCAILSRPLPSHLQQDYLGAPNLECLAATACRFDGRTFEWRKPMNPKIEAAAGGLPAATTPSFKRRAILTLAALGVVYGDIGTSPLYAVRTVDRGDGRHAAPARTRCSARCR